jgi:hypothetical protein
MTIEDKDWISPNFTGVSEGAILTRIFGDMAARGFPVQFTYIRGEANLFLGSTVISGIRIDRKNEGTRYQSRRTGPIYVQVDPPAVGRLWVRERDARTQTFNLTKDGTFKNYAALLDALETRIVSLVNLEKEEAVQDANRKKIKALRMSVGDDSVFRIDPSRDKSNPVNFAIVFREDVTVERAKKVIDKLAEIGIH